VSHKFLQFQFTEYLFRPSQRRYGAILILITLGKMKKKLKLPFESLVRKIQVFFCVFGSIFIALSARTWVIQSGTHHETSDTSKSVNSKSDWHGELVVD